MKKTLPVFGLVISSFLLPFVVSAQTLTAPLNGRVVVDSIKARAEARIELKKETKAVKKIEHVVTGKVTAVNGTNFTLLAKKATYNVDASSAKFFRRFGATSTLSDIQINDEVMVNGTVSSSTSTLITAKIIRNLSLQAKNGSFEGTVSNLTPNGFTLSAKNRKDQVIILTTSTTFVQENKTVSIANLINGSHVVVSGVWDRPNSNVTAKKVRLILTTKQITGTVSSLAGTTLIITGKTSSTIFSIDATNAKLLRQHGSVGTLTELKIGDKVEIRGTQATASSSIMALWIRDLSLTASTTVRQ